MGEIDTKTLFINYYKEYLSYIRHYCYLKLGDHPDYAEDCIQDTFRVLFERLNEDAMIKNVKAFLIKTASNFVKLKYRELEIQKKRIHPIDHHQMDIPYEPDLLDNVSDEMIEMLKNEILDSLNPGEQLLLLQTCKDYKDAYRTTKQLALEYGCSETAVRQRIFVLRQKIRALIKEKLKNL